MNEKTPDVARLNRDALIEKLAAVRSEANALLFGREGAIVVRYIEDAMCRLVAADSLPPLPQAPAV